MIWFSVIGRKERTDVTDVEYSSHPHEINDGKTFLISDFGKIPVQIFGDHNMRNICGAKAVFNRLGITDAQFYDGISSFVGIKRRLEQLGENNFTSVFKDFAHAPSKLAATIDALKKQFPSRELVACLELHTLSSLNKKFIKEYYDTFNLPETAVVFYNPEDAAGKKLDILSEEENKKSFQQGRYKNF